MSIINDALNKAGQSSTPQQRSKPVQVQPTVEKHHRPSRFNWGPLFVLAIVGFVTGPIIAPLMKGPYIQQTGPDGGASQAERSMGKEVPAAAPSAKGQFAIEEAPLPKALPIAKSLSQSMPRFSLSGLVYSKAGSYCLINGRVLKTGETVGGATVQSISPTEVVLNYQGSEIRLAASA